MTTTPTCSDEIGSLICHIMGEVDPDDLTKDELASMVSILVPAQERMRARLIGSVVQLDDVRSRRVNSMT